MKANVKIPYMPKGVHEVDNTRISFLANLMRELSVEVIPHLLVVEGTHLMVNETPPYVIYVSQLITVIYVSQLQLSCCTIPVRF